MICKNQEFPRILGQHDMWLWSSQSDTDPKMNFPSKNNRMNKGNLPKKYGPEKESKHSYWYLGKMNKNNQIEISWPIEIKDYEKGKIHFGI